MPSNVDNLEPRTDIPNEIKTMQIKTIESQVFLVKPGVEVPVVDITELVTFIAALAVVIGKAVSGGWLTLIPSFISLVPKAINAGEGFDRIPAELKYMTQKQKEELAKAVGEQLEFGEATAKVVGLAIDIIFSLKTLFFTLKK
jgi:hypothetical protein